MATVSARTKRQVKRAVVKSEAAVARERERLGQELDGFIDALSGKLTEVRHSVVTAADDSAAAARRGLELAMKKSRKGVRQLEKRWHKMDTPQKATVVGGLLAAVAAAAAAPALIRKVRNR
jgi:hypothetical protein